MPFEGGYDDRWILQDVIKDRSYQLMFVGLRLASIEDVNLRRLTERMHADVGRHFEQLVALAQNRRAAVRGRPRSESALPGTGGYRPVGTESGPHRGWNSPISQGQGAYQGSTEEHRSASEHPMKDTEGYRGVPRFREEEDPKEQS